MKKYFVTAALMLAVVAFAQQLPADLQTAVNNNRIDDNVLKPKLSPDLTYYSKNYKAVFGAHQYTLNNTAFSNTKTIFVAPDDKFYNLKCNKFVTGMPFAGDTVLPYTYSTGAFISGVISMLLGENLTNLENSLSWKIPR